MMSHPRRPRIRSFAIACIAGATSKARRHSLQGVGASVTGKRTLLWLVPVICALVFFLLAWPFTKAHLQALAVLRLVSGQPLPRPLAALVAEPVLTEEVTIETPDGPIRARTYTPTQHRAAPALIVLHGVHHLGMDEPRLISFAAAMASCGLRVLTPELPGIKDYRVDSTTVRVIGETTRWFATRTGGPVGVMGLSFSGGLSLVAGTDPQFRPAFKFIVAVGSQGSMDRVFRFYATDTDMRPDGTTERLTAHEYGPLVLEYDYLEDFLPSGDLAPIRAVLRAHLYEDKSAEAASLARLTPSQAKEASRLMDSASPATRAALAHAVSRHVAQLDSLSPSPRLARLTIPVYLLHGAADNIIPAAETLWMASELQQETLRAALVSPVLSHLDFGESNPTLLDQIRLVHFFALILGAAEQR